MSAIFTRKRCETIWRMGALLLAGLIASCETVAAETSTAAEDKLKAAFVFNFLKFVEWPENSSGRNRDDLVLCTSSVQPAMQDHLEKLAGKATKDGSLQVRTNVSPGQSAGCDALFVRGEAADILTRSKVPHGVLTISDETNFAVHGGIIELFREGDRIRFDINVDAAQAAGLTVSSRLLQLARERRNGANR